MKHIKHFFAMIIVFIASIVILGFLLYGIWCSPYKFLPTLLVVFICCFAFKTALNYLLNVGIIHSNELNDFNEKRNKLKTTLKKLDI